METNQSRHLRIRSGRKESHPVKSKDLTTTLLSPSEGEVDPLALLAPATAVNAEEIISSKTPAAESKTTVVLFDRKEELRILCDEADAKAMELIGLYHAWQVRISGELFPVLLRI